MSMTVTTNYGQWVVPPDAPSVHLKKDWRPDMRYRSSRELQRYIDAMNKRFEDAYVTGRKFVPTPYSEWMTTD